MKKPKKHVSEIVVKITSTGKLSVRMSELQFMDLRRELRPWLSAVPRIETNKLAAKVLMYCVQEIRADWSYGKWYNLAGYRQFRLSPAQASAIAFILRTSQTPYMIELKAALLRAL